MNNVLPLRSRSELPLRKAVWEDAAEKAEEIVWAVRSGGKEALFGYAKQFGEVEKEEELFVGREQLKAAFDSLSPKLQGVLSRTGERISSFASAQLGALSAVSFRFQGGCASHLAVPLSRAGCYAPGGRYPLPSSLLMTGCTARAAGVKEIIAASPKPSPEVKAAAYLAGVELLLAAGGAHAIAALAYGVEGLIPCEIVVGPGNRFVTAAKFLASRDVKIEMLAGPSELLIVADETADPKLVAADLLACAEHGSDSFASLVSLSSELIGAVQVELEKQLTALSTADTARAALAQSFVCEAGSIEDAVEVAETFAPEHLQLVVSDPKAIAPAFRRYGALFLGEKTPEVLGDYGAGPNHVLPTGGTARLRGGLSVFDFLKISTSLEITSYEESRELLSDAAALADIEGLAAHAQAAKLRLRR